MEEKEAIVELRRGGRLIATMTNIRLWDWPWYRCDFKAEPEFAAYRQLFDEEVRLLEETGADAKWDAAYEKIENLDMMLIYPQKHKSTKIFLLHVEGSQARFKAVFEPESL